MAIPLFYKVASNNGVNMRDAPSKTASRLAAIPRDTIVTRIADPTLAAEWYKVNWNNREGYVASAYLSPVSGSPTDSASPAPSMDIVLPPAPAVGIPDRDPARLHPTIRKAVLDTLSDLQSHGMNFRIHEAYRHPERQSYLYASGRTRLGPKVTKAQAWQSMHQYGLAVDLVLFTDKGWSWDASGDNGAKWQAMHEAAKSRGLKPLSFELPHVEPADASWERYLTGDLPPGGDETWYETVSFAAERWRQTGRSPAGPLMAIGQRPALEDA